jgi:leucyl aminopeptidase (aminopeptidase T)
MNEQIKQLWEEAAKTTQSDSWEEQTKFMERFAELIVRECLDQLHVSDPNEDYDKGIYWSREQIKKHFGVE